MTQYIYNKLYSEADRLVQQFIDWEIVYKDLKDFGIIKQHYKKIRTQMFYLSDIVELLCDDESAKKTLLGHLQEELDLLNDFYNYVQYK